MTLDFDFDAFYTPFEMSRKPPPNPITLSHVQRDAAELRAALDSFPQLISSFMLNAGVAETRLSRDGYGSPDFVHQVRRGRNFRLDTLKKMLDYMASY